MSSSHKFTNVPPGCGARRGPSVRRGDDGGGGDEGDGTRTTKDDDGGEGRRRLQLLPRPQPMPDGAGPQPRMPRMNGYRRWSGNGERNGGDVHRRKRRPRQLHRLHWPPPPGGRAVWPDLGYLWGTVVRSSDSRRSHDQLRTQRMRQRGNLQMEETRREKEKNRTEMISSGCLGRCR